MSFKEIIFNQFASEGINLLIKDLQNKYIPKKGRRFNHENITYEIGRPGLKNNCIEFEISSKIPQDEIKTPKEMKSYFGEIKKLLEKEDHKPVLVELESIIWDSKRDSEKEREYIKVVYECPLDDLFDNDQVVKRKEALDSGAQKETLPEVPSIFSTEGKLVLMLVRENIQEIVESHLAVLIKANKTARAS